MKIDESLFDKAEFIKWLEAKADDGIVGQACDSQICPLANFIREEKKLYTTISIDAAMITDGTAPMLPKTHRVWLPRWAQDFVWQIDGNSAEKKKAHYGNWASVSKREALEVLK
jgi:hypothetical protein